MHHRRCAASFSQLSVASKFFLVNLLERSLKLRTYSKRNLISKSERKSTESQKEESRKYRGRKAKEAQVTAYRMSMHRSFAWSDRKFAAHFGVCKQTVLILWLHLQTLELPWTLQMKHLLWSLHFLKVYTSVDVSASFWNVDPKTYSLWVWRVLLLIATTLNTV
jgi:hypothetical protein